MGRLLLISIFSGGALSFATFSLYYRFLVALGFFFSRASSIYNGNEQSHIALGSYIPSHYWAAGGFLVFDILRFCFGGNLIYLDSQFPTKGTKQASIYKLITS
jgi:hypothetical protein